MSHYNDFDDPQALADLGRLHRACRTIEVSYSLEYNEYNNTWDITIHSSDPAVNYLGRSHSLSDSLELAIKHAEAVGQGVPKFT